MQTNWSEKRKGVWRGYIFWSKKKKDYKEKPTENNCVII